MNFLFATALSLLMTSPVFAEEAKGHTKDQAEIKRTMGEFLNHFLKLKKYLVSDEEFQSSKNEKEILVHLKGLRDASRKTQHNPLLNQENFKFSREVLEDHFRETERVFRVGKKPFARWMLNASLGICMSCHTQIPAQGRDFPFFLNDRGFSSRFDQAEFLFATRNFEGAQKIYRDLVEKFPQSKVDFDKAEKSILRCLAYQVRVKRDLPGAKSLIADFQKNKKLPESLKKNMNQWQEELTRWEKKSLPSSKETKPNQVLSFISQNLPSGSDPLREEDDKDLISNLIVSGVIYDYLDKNPDTSAAPDLLYRLARIDRKLTTSLFYSLADMYLKECILKFPGSSVASQCYQEYEAEIIFGYTGSAGTELPKEVSEELSSLKQYIESKGSIPLKRITP